MKNEDKFIKNIDDKMVEWFECMKIMKDSNNKCYDILFWKQGSLQKIEFYLNNKINVGVILENVDIVSTLLLK
jgi:hypothetical protein